MRLRTALFLLAALVFVFSGAISVTIMFGTNSSGLITLAGVRDDDFSINPFDGDVSVISPSMAEWFLLSFDWPYERPGVMTGVCGEMQPNIQAAIATRQLHPDWAAVDDRMLRLVNHFIDRGDSIEERYCGYTALHSATLFGDAKVVRVLLDHSADHNSVVELPGRKIDGMNALQLANFLSERDPAWMRETIQALEVPNNAT